MGDVLLERAAQAIRRSWDQDAVSAASAVLAAAMSAFATSAGWCRWEHGSWTVIAYPEGASQRSEVELFVGRAQVWLSADEAEARGLMLVAAARQSRRLTSSGVEVA
jgi:hypothetical protein